MYHVLIGISVWWLKYDRFADALPFPSRALPLHPAVYLLARRCFCCCCCCSGFMRRNTPNITGGHAFVDDGFHVLYVCAAGVRGHVYQGWQGCLSHGVSVMQSALLLYVAVFILSATNYCTRTVAHADCVFLFLCLYFFFYERAGVLLCVLISISSATRWREKKTKNV